MTTAPHGYWKKQENRIKATKQMVERLATKGIQPHQIKAEHFHQEGLSGLLRYHKDSPFLALEEAGHVSIREFLGRVRTGLSVHQAAELLGTPIGAFAKQLNRREYAGRKLSEMVKVEGQKVVRVDLPDEILAGILELEEELTKQPPQLAVELPVAQRQAVEQPIVQPRWIPSVEIEPAVQRQMIKRPLIGHLVEQLQDDKTLIKELAKKHLGLREFASALVVGLRLDTSKKFVGEAYHPTTFFQKNLRPLPGISTKFNKLLDFCINHQIVRTKKLGDVVSLNDHSEPGTLGETIFRAFTRATRRLEH